MTTLKVSPNKLRLQELFDRMLEEYPIGLSSTSINKFDDIKSFFAQLLKIPVTEVYATGAGTRPTNLEVRLTQGLQATKHTIFGIGFMKADSEAEAERLSDSALVTVEKFLVKEKASYDAVGILVSINNKLRFTRLLEAHGTGIGEKLTPHFPELVVRTSKASAATPSSRASRTSKEKKSDGASLWLDEGATRLNDLVSTVFEDFKSAHLIFPQQLVHRFCASLLTKRFVVLTGLSGSGKTRIADAFGRWITEDPSSQCKIISVGADWTSNQNIFGYPDALDHNRYESTPALEIILEASDPENSDKPYFLILDEMNLSHVERYFADFLSAIESGREIDLYRGAGREEAPPRLVLSPNLFVIGTVNVDETTYMFSPKVLDRANVIEFRASLPDVAAFLDNPQAVDIDSISGRGTGFGANFVLEASIRETLLEDEERAFVKDELLKWFLVMERAGKQFGFRTASEIVRFIFFHKRLASEGWEILDAVDAQIVQKILPRLHGSRTEMEPLIWALSQLAYKNIATDENLLEEHIIGPMVARDRSLDPNQLLSDEADLEVLKRDARLKLSFEKLWRMSERVKEGFINSTDA